MVPQLTALVVFLYVPQSSDTWYCPRFSKSIPNFWLVSLGECTDTGCATHAGLSSFHLFQVQAELLQPRLRKSRWVLFSESKLALLERRKDKLTGANESAILLMQAVQVKVLLPIGRIIQSNGL